MTATESAHEDIGRIPAREGVAVVYEHGWQSWSPSAPYRVGEAPHRPLNPDFHVLGHRGDRTPSPGTYWGEGLLAVRPEPDGPVHVFGVERAEREVPSVSARHTGGHLVVAAERRAAHAVRHVVDEGPGGLDGALARWADRFAAASGLGTPRPAPTLWSSWYQYFADVTEADVRENLAAMDTLGLPIDVVQIDDGYQAHHGDWLDPSDRFRSLPGLVADIRARGRRAGIWLAPFLGGQHSRLVADHPEWLLKDDTGQPRSVCEGWDQHNYALDPTHPGLRERLTEVITTMREWGVDFFKLDFVYAGAVPGRHHEPATTVEAYRSGMRMLREAAGDAYLLGCGAPLLPSAGYVDPCASDPTPRPRTSRTRRTCPRRDNAAPN